MTVILDNIRSIHNVGSVFRTADAADVEKIYLCGITPTPLDEFKRPRQQFTKVSLGAESTIKWEKCAQIYRVLDKLKKQGYKIYVVEQAENSVPYYKTKLRANEKIALVFGHELKGVSKAALERADKILEIPMAGKKESLNVSIAFAIVAFHLKYAK